MNESATSAGVTRSVEITRIYDAPRELVYKAWTDPVHLARWFGPRHFTNPVCECDARVGGKLRIVMRSPQGSEHPMKGIFKEVVKNSRLVFTNTAVDANDQTLIDGITSVTFEEQDGKTKMTMKTTATAFGAIAEQMIAGMDAGWSQSFDKLGEMLTQK